MKPSPIHLRRSTATCWWCTTCLAIGLAGCRPAENNAARTTTENVTDAASGNAIVTAVEKQRRAEHAIRVGNLDLAASLLRECVLLDPQNTTAIELLGDIAAQRREPQRAIELYQEVANKNPNASFALQDKLAQQTMVTGRPYDVIALQQQMLKRDPNLIQVRYDLAGLASMLGLDQIATEQLRWLLLHQEVHEEGLTVLAHPEFVQPDEQLCLDVLQRCPEDERAKFGLAKIDAMKLKWKEAAERLKSVVERHPHFIPANALYGRALVELNDSDSLARWIAQLPSDIEDSPVYWLAAGQWAQQQGNTAMAARAFCEAVEREGANNGDTLARLNSSLSQLGRHQDALLVSRRSEQVARLHDATKTFYERGSLSQAAAMVVARSLVELGRLWEAEAWAQLAMELPQEPVATISQEHLAIRSQLSADTPWQLSAGQVGNQIDLNDLPQLAWRPNAANQKPVRETNQIANFQLADRAATLGLNHVSTISANSPEQSHWIYRSYGAGAAVLDFDLDGWPDVALGVSDGLPMQRDSHPDRFYRNLAGTFRDITLESRILNNGFSQGLAVGDYDSDGFPDLFVCNYGRNCLFRNNGDGTWTDVTHKVGLEGSFWTVASALVDINSDGFADLFTVNYCTGTRPFEQECRNRMTGKLSHCTPLDFEAEPDRVWAGRGDGTFEDVTQRWKVEDTSGRGLGLVVGTLDARPGIDIYVANDMTANHLWSSSGSDEDFCFDELGIAQGIAVSGQSLSQASMGIAAGDADRDGDLDLFVTNFTDEYNTLYEQISDGLWVDRSYQVGLAEASMDMLGFGTQFIDLDNDGGNELIVANGHVSDLGRADVPYRMPAQVFHRGNDETWDQVNGESLGDYFRRDHLGRALVTIDADRNGFVDLLITHLFDPVALIMNETGRDPSTREEPGNSVSLVLKATRGHRDAIGATVTATTEKGHVYAQLTAGDGYMGSNQRQISLGMDDLQEIQEITVCWPSRATEPFGKLEAGYEYLIVEGTGDAFMLSKHRTSL